MHTARKSKTAAKWTTVPELVYQKLHAHFVCHLVPDVYALTLQISIIPYEGNEAKNVLILPS
jgi:hypothetical protein